MNYVACAKDLTQLKKELPWLCEVETNALQHSLKALESAYKNFFRRIKNGEKPGYPCFKKKHNNRKSFKTPNNKGSIRIIAGSIHLAKLGFVKCRVSKEVKGRILSATVSQNPSGKYYVAICFQ